MKKNRWLAFCLAGFLLLTLGACANTDSSTQTDDHASDSTEIQTEVQYDYQLKAGEVTEIYDTTFDKMVTITVDPDSTRDGANDLRAIFFLITAPLMTVLLS